MSEARCEGQQCWAHLEWFCEHAGLARVFDGNKKYGDPYCYALPFVVREKFPEPLANGKRGYVEFVGVIKVMSACQYKALYEAMYSAGWGVLSSRKKGDREFTVEVGRHRWKK